MSDSQVTTDKKDPERPVDVIYLLHTVAYGGIESVILNWIDAIDRARYRIHIVVFANRGETEKAFVEVAESRGVHITKIPWGRRKPLIKASRALAHLVRELDARIVHAHGWYAELVAAAVQMWVPVKTLTTVYVWHDYEWKRNLIQLVSKYAIRTLDQITVHCEYARKGTVERGIPDHCLKTLICGFNGKPCSMSPEERRRLRADWGAGEDDLVLVNVARFYPEKAQDALLRIFRRVQDQVPNTRLWIAGVGPLEDELKALSTELGLDRQVRFVGFASQLPKLLALADIQVHPAHVEGVPLALLSGMAAGLPIVASDVGGISEIVRPRPSGILVPSGDEDGFTAAVLSLVRDPERRRELGEAGVDFVNTDYALDTAVGAVMETYDVLLATGQPHRKTSNERASE